MGLEPIRKDKVVNNKNNITNAIKIWKNKIQRDKYDTKHNLIKIRNVIKHGTKLTIWHYQIQNNTNMNFYETKLNAT